MFHISHQQWAALEDHALSAFEERTYAHLLQWFPDHCALLGRQQMGAVIRRGLERANHHGLTPECGVRSYVEFMCLLGSGFDADPLLPWAAEILNDQVAGDPVERGDRLYDRAWQYLDHVSADFQDWTGQAANNRFVADLRPLRDERHNPLTPATVPAFSALLEQRLVRLFPAKCNYVGMTALQEHIRRGIGRAFHHGITGEKGVILVTLLMFLVGDGFDNDPLLPWVSATLADPHLTRQEEKVDQLFGEGVAFLRRWWDLAESQGKRG